MPQRPAQPGPPGADKAAFLPLAQPLTSEHVAAKTIRVLVVAEPIVAWGLEKLVQSAHPRFDVAATCHRAADFVDHAQAAAVDVALVDLDGDDGADAVKTLVAHQRIKILAISGSRDVALQDAGHDGGARRVHQRLLGRISQQLVVAGDDGVVQEA